MTSSARKFGGTRTNRASAPASATSRTAGSAWLRAVGDQSALYAAVENSSNPQLQGYLEDAADPAIGLGWSLRSDTDVRAPAYQGLLDLTYAKPLARR
ncbi:hypothetical protein [Nocardioides sp. Iso805N]|uniref:hypothetical protein n=1 Tax=Nocardioides sp. Iso805N TaxID=1283287 RepID=UPI000399864C|nr:hypothetical protein [Nocardioides sp. Iso805N]